jgi:hypothetical protein
VNAVFSLIAFAMLMVVISIGGGWRQPVRCGGIAGRFDLFQKSLARQSLDRLRDGVGEVRNTGCKRQNLVERRHSFADIMARTTVALRGCNSIR